VQLQQLQHELVVRSLSGLQSSDILSDTLSEQLLQEGLAGHTGAKPPPIPYSSSADVQRQVSRTTSTSTLRRPSSQHVAAPHPQLSQTGADAHAMRLDAPSRRSPPAPASAAVQLTTASATGISSSTHGSAKPRRSASWSAPTTTATGAALKARRDAAPSDDMRDEPPPALAVPDHFSTAAEVSGRADAESVAHQHAVSADLLVEDF
jgi:hypothetical protein